MMFSQNLKENTKEQHNLGNFEIEKKGYLPIKDFLSPMELETNPSPSSGMSKDSKEETKPGSSSSPSHTQLRSQFIKLKRIAQIIVNDT